MFKYTIAAVATLAVLAGSPALATGKVKGGESAARDQQTDAGSAPTRYCYIVPATTGTILDRKVCKTLDQWRAVGVDPTKQQKN